ncbi:DNA internalization-related competence protein ComEC/Rec2 [Pseudorhodoferax aquiterrae]|uniref:DNA internalization-related competence protein ComEC/Rec2 n=1 Tax=Pseudorhodoferax aquiterrae TaxID=747304 RepID=A0ABQ3G137_9BURK|nr:DNA internalization-related competence protein ComEC/Rec2 [Pseudorhodoferax aquiterrae]GHC80640.1 DNA internalization-related competence protein ComEC/Rec2 [Pseudorhodoferax aquiterrae]
MTEEAVQASRTGPWLSCCIGFVLGTAAQLQQPALWAAWPYASLGLLGCALAWFGWRHRWPAARLLAALGVAALAFGAVGLRALAFEAQALAPALEGRDLVLTGRVAAMPQPGDLAVRLLLDVQAAQLDGAPVHVPPRVELSWYRGSLDGVPQQTPELLAGDRWSLQARLRAPHGQRNPHGFDYELWQWERGVQATGYVRAGPKDSAPRLLERGWRHPVERARQAVRGDIFARVAEPGRAGVVAALAMGDQGAVERADWDLFRATGVSHLLSVSGLHVTMFAWLATALVGWGWRRLDRLGWSACLWCPAPHAGLVGGVALAAAYALFSGWGVPAQRTLAMLTVVALLRLAGRQWPWPLVWAVAGLAVLALDPWALLQAGFWLSFVAVGVLFASDAGPAAAGPWARVRRLLREQAIVTVALAPLSLMLFQQVSLVGLVANLLAIPWVTLLLTPLALLGVVCAPLWDLAAATTSAMLAVLAWLAQWPLASLTHAAVPWSLGAAALLGAVLLVLRLPLGVRMLGLPLVLPALFWQPARPAPGQFDLLAADIGQGNAVLLRTARHSLLYDTGPRHGQDSDAGHRVLVPLLRALGERLDTVVVSHADSDHSGGAATVLAAQPQAALRASLPEGHALAARHAVTPCVAGQQWEWDGVRFEVLHPPAGAARDAKPNTVSCVLRVAAQGRAVLLAGDIEQAQEQWLVASGAPLQADLLLVPHHGSKTSSSTALLRVVAPRFALVQAGYRNRFGHPAPEIVQRLQAHGASVVASPACGAAQWRSDRPERIDCARAQQPRYWRHRL